MKRFARMDAERIGARRQRPRNAPVPQAAPRRRETLVRRFAQEIVRELKVLAGGANYPAPLQLLQAREGFRFLRREKRFQERDINLPPQRGEPRGQPQRGRRELIEAFREQRVETRGAAAVLLGAGQFDGDEWIAFALLGETGDLGVLWNARRSDQMRARREIEGIDTASGQDAVAPRRPEHVAQGLVVEQFRIARGEDERHVGIEIVEHDGEERERGVVHPLCVIQSDHDSTRRRRDGAQHGRHRGAELRMRDGGGVPEGVRLPALRQNRRQPRALCHRQPARRGDPA